MKFFLPLQWAWPMVCPVLLCASLTLSNDANATNHTAWFTENKGQVIDQYGRERSDVKFMYVNSGFHLLLRGDGFSYELVRTVHIASLDEATAENNYSDEDDAIQNEDQATISRIDVSLTGCNPHAVVESAEPSDFYQNFYTNMVDGKGITGVRSFRQIIYHNIYPGIDLVFEVSNDSRKNPEYHFILHPGSDIRDIRMNYSGSGNTCLNEHGDLCMNLQNGSIAESHPVAFYQNNSSERIPVSFHLRNSHVSLTANVADRNKTVVIDPTISWATYYGGSSLDMPDELGISNEDEIYVTGRTESVSQIATTGSYHVTYGGGQDDSYLIKFDQNGNLVWATYYGGKKVELGYCMCMDNTNHIYICGKTSSTSGIATPGAYQTTYGGGGHDSYIAKFNSDGTLAWSTYYGGEGLDRVLTCTTDKYGTLYVGGYTESLNGIATPGAFKVTGDIKGDAFLAKFTTDGALLFGTYFGSLGQDRAHAVVIDDRGNIITTGTTTSFKGIATTGAFQTVYGGNTDMYLNKFTNDGSLIWSTYVGGTGDDRGRALGLDAAENIYLLGQVASTNIPTTPETFKPVFTPANSTDQDALVAKFDSSGNKIWATYYGGNGNEQPKSLKVDRFGSAIYISGSTRSSAGLATPDAFQKKLGGPNDAFFARINYNAGSLMYSTYYGGKKSESNFNGTWYGAPMEIDHEGNIILASATLSSDSITYGNAYKNVLASDTAFDIFLVKFTEDCFDPYENSDVLSQAPPLIFDADATKRSLRGTLQSSSDVDYYQFPLPSPSNNIKCTVSALSTNYILTVFNSDQIPVASLSGSANSPTSVIINNTAPGKYYAGIIGDGGSPFSTPLCYQLDIEVSNAPFVTKDENLEASSSEGIQVFPNPAADNVSISWKEPIRAGSDLEVRSISGKLLLRIPLTVGQHEITIPVNSLAAGTYLFSIPGMNNRIFGKFVRE